MDSAADETSRRKLVAYTAPMGLFLLLLAVNSGLKHIGAQFWLGSAEYWIYPMQTILCALLLVRFRREYELRAPRKLAFTLALGVAVFALWISPQTFFGFAPRTIGFDPDTFGSQPALYWLTVALRFARLVIVVPLVEEIFWRGFLLRYFVDERFERVPFGAFSSLSFAVVTLAFCFTHSRADWIAAAITGAIYNLVAYRTRSLGSCAIAHATTNLLLGLWIMKTHQWGFW
jgi:CAAX prenyl protease-like protein